MGNFIKAFEEMTKEDIQEAGGKAANLGELTQAGFNVPPGVCVTSKSLIWHIEQNNLQSEIDKIVNSFDYDDFPAMADPVASPGYCLQTQQAFVGRNLIKRGRNLRLSQRSG